MEDNIKNDKIENTNSVPAKEETDYKSMYEEKNKELENYKKSVHEGKVEDFFKQHNLKDKFGDYIKPMLLKSDEKDWNSMKEGWKEKMPEIFKDEALGTHQTEFAKRLTTNIDESKNSKTEMQIEQEKLRKNGGV